jgi:hypothetical protein
VQMLIEAVSTFHLFGWVTIPGLVDPNYKVSATFDV